MSKVEEILNDKKLEMDELIVPEELKDRLSNALQNRSFSNKQKGKWGMRIAILAIAFFLVTYNIDTLAFYGRELLGFENIMNGTLKELNEMGMGQSIEKSYEFSDGTKVTLNGVMIDDNQLLAFYTIENPRGSIENLSFNSEYMKGLIGSHANNSASGKLSEDKKTIKWIGEFNPPFAFEKKLTWVFNIKIDGKMREGRISFALDRSKAMGHTIKRKLNKALKVDGTDIHFDTITASPTTTIVKGTIQNIVQLAKDQISGERIFSPEFEIKLLANGNEVSWQGGGVSTDMKGIKFDVRYDALPQDLESLKLHLVKFGAEHEVNELVELDKSSKGQNIKVDNQEITIEKIYESKGETYITITTEENVVLSKVYLLADDNRIELTETMDNKHDKKTDGTITHTRTLRFETVANKLKLEIKRIRYAKIYDEYIDIPIE